METKEMQGGAECGKCFSRGHWGHLLVKILIVIFIFWCGVQFGELKSLLRGGYGYGYGMMGAYRNASGQNYYYGPGGMMGWFAQ